MCASADTCLHFLQGARLPCGASLSLARAGAWDCAAPRSPPRAARNARGARATRARQKAPCQVNFALGAPSLQSCWARTIPPGRASATSPVRSPRRGLLLDLEPPPRAAEHARAPGVGPGQGHLAERFAFATCPIPKPTTPSLRACARAAPSAVRNHLAGVLTLPITPLLRLSWSPLSARPARSTPDTLPLPRFSTQLKLNSSLETMVGSARRDKGKGRNAGLTEEQKQEIREAFDLFDTDGSGTWPQRPVGALAEFLVSRPPPAPACLRPRSVHTPPPAKKGLREGHNKRAPVDPAAHRHADPSNAWVGEPGGKLPRVPGCAHLSPFVADVDRPSLSSPPPPIQAPSTPRS